MAYSNPSTFVAGNVLTAAQQNVLANNDRFFHGPPTVKVRASTSLSSTSGGWKALNFSIEDWDNNTMWSSTAPSKIFCRTAGKFEIEGLLSFAASTAGNQRVIGIRFNTTSGAPNRGFVSFRPILGGNQTPIGICNTIAMTTGQYFQLVGLQDAGTINLVSSTASGFPFVTAKWYSS